MLDIDIDILVDTLTFISWLLFTTLVLLGLPNMYRSIWSFVVDDDISTAIFAFSLPLCFCAGWAIMVYWFPMLSGALMCYFIAKSKSRTS